MGSTERLLRRLLHVNRTGRNRCKKWRARALREDPEASLADFFAGLAEVDQRILKRPEVRALFSEMLQEAVRQGATGWVGDNLRLARPWPFRLDEIGVDVPFHPGEADVVAPRTVSLRRYQEAICA
jgi:hypothetical protein